MRWRRAAIFRVNTARRRLLPAPGLLSFTGRWSLQSYVWLQDRQSAWRLIPWYAAVIGGGLAILAAPLGLQQFSDRFVNGRAALLSFAATGGVLALLLLWLAS